jgi:hypothetical protein
LVAYDVLEDFRANDLVELPPEHVKFVQIVNREAEAVFGDAKHPIEQFPITLDLTLLDADAEDTVAP